MTMPTPQQPQPMMRQINLPKAVPPVLTRMISDPLFPGQGEGGKTEPVTWVLSFPHPLVPDMKVLRMFMEQGSVEIYSVSADGTEGIRNHIPLSKVRLVEESMPIDIFAEELIVAESGSADDDDDDDDEAPEAPPQEPAPSATDDTLPPTTADPPSDGQPDAS